VGAPADRKTGLVASMAVEAGARLPQGLPASELVAFEVRPGGAIAVELADGTKTNIASERQASAAFFPAFVIGAETFLRWMGRYASLPIGASPVGRRFVRRSAVVGGKPCVRFSEAGRDV
jgi:hypothetical protein